MDSRKTTNHATLLLVLLSASMMAASTLDLRTARAIGPPRGSTIVQAPSCVAPPSGMVSWWPGDGNADDIQGGNNGTLQGGATFGTGEVGQGFSLNGTSAYVSVPDNANLYPSG